MHTKKTLFRPVQLGLSDLSFHAAYNRCLPYAHEC